MANRLLRDWTASDTIDKLSEGAEVFFTRLIMKADDHGCFYGSTKLLKAALFPLRDHSLGNIKGWRDECESCGVIQCYLIEGKEYVKILNFGQRLRSMVSKFPQPADIPPTNVGGSRTSVSNPPPELEEKRREVEGKGSPQIEPDFFEHNAQAYAILSGNYHDTDAATKIVANNGWPGVTENDVRALIHHFIETQVDVKKQDKADIRQHLRRWLNKQPVDKMREWAKNILENHARRGQRPAQGQNAQIRGHAEKLPDTG